MPEKTQARAAISAGNAETIVPDWNPCPNAADCNSITLDDYEDAAVCNFCGQHLDRANLLELFFGVRA